jgi:hypothetical protein
VLSRPGGAPAVVLRPTPYDYVPRGLVALTLPTGDHRWDVEDLIRQFRAAPGARGDPGGSGG